MCARITRDFSFSRRRSDGEPYEGDLTTCCARVKGGSCRCFLHRLLSRSQPFDLKSTLSFPQVKQNQRKRKNPCRSHEDLPKAEPSRDRVPRQLLHPGNGRFVSAFHAHRNHFIERFPTVLAPVIRRSRGAAERPATSLASVSTPSATPQHEESMLGYISLANLPLQPALWVRARSSRPQVASHLSALVSAMLEYEGRESYHQYHLIATSQQSVNHAPPTYQVYTSCAKCSAGPLFASGPTGTVPGRMMVDMRHDKNVAPFSDKRRAERFLESAAFRTGFVRTRQDKGGFGHGSVRSAKGSKRPEPRRASRALARAGLRHKQQPATEL